MSTWLKFIVKSLNARRMADSIANGGAPADVAAARNGYVRSAVTQAAAMRDAEDVRLMSRRMARLYDFCPLSTLAGLGAIVAMVYMLTGISPAGDLHLWGGAMVTIQVLRLGLYGWFRKSFDAAATSIESLQGWERGYALLGGLLGVGWAILTLYFMPPFSVLHQMLIAFVVVGLALGGYAAMGASQLSLYSYSAPMLAGLITALACSGDWNCIAAAFLVAMWSGVMFRLSRKSYQAQIHEFKCEVDAEELVKELAKAEDVCKAAAFEHELIFNNPLLGVMLVKRTGDGDDEWVISACNLRGARMLGYGEGELEGMSTSQFYSDKTAFYTDSKAVSDSLTRKGFFDDSMQVMRKDGSVFWCHRSAILVDRSNIASGILWTFEDVSARKAEEAGRRDAEARLNLLRSVSPVGSWDLVPAEGTVSFSMQFCRLLGFDDAKGLPESFSIEAAMHDEDRGRVATAIQAHLVFREPLLQRVRLKCRDGSYRRFVLGGQATWDDSGQADLFMGTIQMTSLNDEPEAAVHPASMGEAVSSA
jgi:PAS domain S-box-containing protein